MGGSESTPTNSESTKSFQETNLADTPSEDTLPQPTCSNLKHSIFLRILLSKEAKPVWWESILEEYSTLIKTDKSDNVFELLKKINFCAAKLHFVNEALQFMKKYGYDAEYAELLTRYGFDYIEPSEGEQLWKQIFLVETDAKSLIVLLNQYNIQYRKMFPEAEAEEDQLNELDYLKELAILSKFIGHRINPEEIYVIEFAAIVNTFIEHNKQRKNGIDE